MPIIYPARSAIIQRARQHLYSQDFFTVVKREALLGSLDAQAAHSRPAG
jgi:hypothetical protein